MASIFDTFSLEDARTAVQLDKQRAAEIDSYLAFVSGDHWQNWDGWIGPQPAATDEDATSVRQEIERGFVSRNALGECVGRHVNGVLGRDVKWKMVPRRKLDDDEQPTADEQARIDEAADLLEEWVRARELNQQYDDVGTAMLTAGRAYQRVFVPPGELLGDGTLPAGDMADNLGRVYVHFPAVGEAVLYTHPRTQSKCSIYLYREVSQDRPSQATQGQGEERAELTYLDGDQTIVRIVGAGGPIVADDGADFSYGLGNRLLVTEMHRKPLVNPQVVSQQKLLNLALTMKQRNVILGGFLERVAINAQMDGAYETGPDGVRRFVPNSLPVGAGAMTTLTGYVLTGPDGQESLATPSMLWRDPVSVETFLATENSAYHAILAECHQLHYAMADDATASGTSRQTAMAAYLIDLLQTKQQVDKGWAALLETALALAAVLSGQAGRYDDLRVSAEASVDPGPISPDMIRVVLDLWRDQKLTLRTGLSWIGVEDVDSEISGLGKERAEDEASGESRLAGVESILERVRQATTTTNGPTREAMPA